MKTPNALTSKPPVTRCRGALLPLIVLALLTSACSYENRLGFANALGRAAYRIEHSTTCSTHSYRTRGGYASSTTCY